MIEIAQITMAPPRAQVAPVNRAIPAAVTIAPRTRWVHPHAVRSNR